jgi:hypothetical protein
MPRGAPLPDRRRRNPGTQRLSEILDGNCYCNVNPIEASRQLCVGKAEDSTTSYGQGGSA